MDQILSRDEVQARVMAAMADIHAGRPAPANPYPALHAAHALWEELMERALVAAIAAQAEASGA